MDRSFYLQLACSGMRMPIGTDLVLREAPDHEAILLDGPRLGRVIEEAARRFRTPLAIHLMDLALEKQWLLARLGVSPAQIPTFHFHRLPGSGERARIDAPAEMTPRLRASVEAIEYVATHTDLVPAGMSIGPFSLMTKLVADPITPVYLAGSGVQAVEDEEVRLVEGLLALAERVVMQSIELQVRAGARVMFVAEPAANKVYFSPNQIAAGSDIFERYAMSANRRIKAFLDRLGVDLIFHCCGELVDSMVEQFATLDPAILSLGSSRRLWDDARLVPKTTVLYGNLPSKRFYSSELSCAEVAKMAAELTEKMKAVGHPFILGSECDVLSVAGAERAIHEKVDAFLNCGCR